MIDVVDIINSWIKSFDPNSKESELAESRLKICLDCEHKKSLIKNLEISVVCNQCGCPIKKKVFSSKTCPIGKWDNVDLEFRNKNKKLI